MFLLPNGILDGGATGIALLLIELYNIDISITLILVSVPFFILGYFVLTPKILLKSSLVILALSVLLYFENFQTLTDDKLIVCTFGGLFLGIGIGLAIKNGAVLDGSEILGLFINERFGVSISSFILAFNILLFLITFFLLNAETAMYSTLTYFITSKAVDLTLQGFENYSGLMIVSTKSKMIQDVFNNDFGQGITIYKGVQGIGKQGRQEDMEVIHIVVNRIDRNRLYRMIHNIDAQAFIVEFDVNDVKGGKLKRYLELSDD